MTKKVLQTCRGRKIIDFHYDFQHQQPNGNLIFSDGGCFEVPQKSLCAVPQYYTEVFSIYVHMHLFRTCSCFRHCRLLYCVWP